MPLMGVAKTLHLGGVWRPVHLMSVKGEKGTTFVVAGLPRQYCYACDRPARWIRGLGCSFDLDNYFGSLLHHRDLIA